MKAFFFLAPIALFVSSCLENTSPTSTLSVNINHVVGTQPLEFNSIIYQNAAGNEYGISTLKYFLSEIEIVSEGGSEILPYHYVDAQDNSTLEIQFFELDVSSYNSIRFVFGSRNITSNTLVNPPENNMEWPEQLGGGYHNMKLEGRYIADGLETNYNTHTGPTNSIDYSVDFEFALPDFLEHGDASIYLTFDINEMYTNPNIYDFEDFWQAIMMNESAQQILSANAANAFSLKNDNPNN